MKIPKYHVDFMIDGKRPDEIKKEQNVRQLAELFEQMKTHQKVLSALASMASMYDGCRRPMIDHKTAKAFGLDYTDAVSDLIAMSINLHKQGLLEISE